MDRPVSLGGGFDPESEPMALLGGCDRAARMLRAGPGARVEGVQARDENVLRVTAVEKHAIVARARNQAEGRVVVIQKRDTGIQVVEEEVLTVVAELRNHDERNIALVDHRIGPDTRAQGDAEIPAAHGHAIAGLPFALARGAGAAWARATRAAASRILGYGMSIFIRHFLRNGPPPPHRGCSRL